MVRWIKVDVDMYKNEKLRRIRQEMGGVEADYLWGVMLMIAGKSNCGGKLMLSRRVAYGVADLAQEAQLPTAVVEKALELFKRFDMVCRYKKTIAIRDWNNHQSIEKLERMREQARLRQQRYRQRQKEKLSEQFQNDDGNAFK